MVESQSKEILDGNNGGATLLQINHRIVFCLKPIFFLFKATCSKSNMNKIYVSVSWECPRRIRPQLFYQYKYAIALLVATCIASTKENRNICCCCSAHTGPIKCALNSLVGKILVRVNILLNLIVKRLTSLD